MRRSIFKKHHRGWLSLLVTKIFGRDLSTHHQQSRHEWFKVVAFGLVIVLTTAALTIHYSWEPPLVSPLTQGSWLTFPDRPQTLLLDSQSPSANRVVYGFLPYWNLDQVVLQPELTHLSYFGLNIAPDGSIVTKDQDGNTHPGYNKLDSDRLLSLINQATDEYDAQFELTLIQFENDSIKQLANNPEAHQTLIEAIDSILLSAPISGINIDIEYTGEADQELRDNFAQLIETISSHLGKKFDHVTLSIDMYASASSNKQLWDVPRISKAVDYVVVMAYDFHRRGSSQAGPVAPLFGGKNKWDTDIHQHLVEYLRYVPREKVLLGLPFYGYGWQTESRSPQANSFPDTGFTATYETVQKLLTEKTRYQVQTGWDDHALCPYLSYIEDDDIFMIYYEDVTSISYKLEYVKQLNLAGIAVWALGYEGQNRDLWDVVAKL